MIDHIGVQVADVEAYWAEQQPESPPSPVR